PYTQSWSFGFERQLPWQMVFDADYTGEKGPHLYYGGAGFLDFLPSSYDQLAQNPGSAANQATIATLNGYVNNPFYNVITDPNSDLSGSQLRQWRLDIPFPEYDNFGQDGAPWAVSSYNALKLKLQKNMSNDLQLLVSYTFSKSLDDASNNDYNSSWLGLSSDSLEDPNCLRCEYSVSVFDLPQIFQFSYVYRLPVGRGHWLGSNWGTWANALLGGWQTSGIWRFTDGFPIVIGLAGYENNPLPTYGSQRPDLLAKPVRGQGANMLTDFFENANAAFAQPAEYALGSAPRTLPWIRQPGMANANLAAFKTFQISENKSFEFRAEADNALNHVQFGSPDSTFGSSNFGQIFGTANGPREVQLGLTFQF
ncbi:MAG: hypothetical protein ACREKE_05410, partial [bacterium]